MIERVNEAMEAINRHWADPENLSALILKLSLIYGELGDLVTEAEFEMDSVKERYDYDVATRILELVEEGSSVAAAEPRAKQEYRQGFREQLTAKKNYGILKRKRDSVEKVIDASRSRLSLIKSDIRNS